MAARAIHTWDAEIAAARAILAERNPPDLIDVLLADGEADMAWNAATAGDDEIFSLAMAPARRSPANRAAPGDAVAVYLRLADNVLERADKRAYRDAVGHLKAARRAATEAHRVDEFTEHLSRTSGPEPAASHVHGDARQGRPAVRQL